MPYSAGTFTFTSNTFAPSPVTGTTISSTDAASTWSEIATGLTTCMLKDGTQTVTANIPMATFKFTGLGAGTATGQSARYDEVVALTVNSQSAAYTTILSDAGKFILHPTADDNPRTFTIDSNANVAYPIGTTISFVNQINTVTIAITSDTIVLAGAGTTGSRTLAASGLATVLKVATTTWFISGVGIS